MKKIIVTGCNGQLGRAINAQYAGSTEYELVNTDVEDFRNIVNFNDLNEETYSMQMTEQGKKEFFHSLIF